ncbi:hypothetical protein CRE_10799 [Caenorhabditis remanei]|uniref:Uncharacterized protein n=1 Tax=Caenorhabditis remanei TaxID=31234 RepID=E3NWV0_CAERE|nr:hypothetical protein CRE_10799 [Caenorhabditis remanei]
MKTILKSHAHFFSMDLFHTSGNLDEDPRISLRDRTIRRDAEKYANMLHPTVVGIQMVPRERRRLFLPAQELNKL